MFVGEARGRSRFGASAVDLVEFVFFRKEEDERRGEKEKS